MVYEGTLRTRSRIAVIQAWLILYLLALPSYFSHISMGVVSSGMQRHLFGWENGRRW